MGFHCGLTGKESSCNAGDLGSIPGLGRFPGEGKGYPLQCSGLENSMHHIVHGVTKSQTWLSDFHFHSVIWIYCNLFPHLPVERHCFQFLTIVNKAPYKHFCSNLWKPQTFQTENFNCADLRSVMYWSGPCMYWLLFWKLLGVLAGWDSRDIGAVVSYGQQLHVVLFQRVYIPDCWLFNHSTGQGK